MSRLVYPNPVRDRLTVLTPDAWHTNVILRNSLGQTVLNAQTHGTKTITLDVAHIAPGLHILEVSNSKAIRARQRIIVD